MAVATKLNPAAAPFPDPYAPLHHLAPPAPPPFPLADAACPPNFPFVTYCCVAAAPAGHIGFCFPAGLHPPCSSPPPLCKGAVVPGRPPHKLMAAFSGLRGGAGKPVKPWKKKAPSPLAAAAIPAVVPAPPPRKPRLKAERSMAKGKPKPKPKGMPRAPRPRKAAGPRARRAQRERESTPPPP
ncbi:unnamed protein product [Urochloa humidicola]